MGKKKQLSCNRRDFLKGTVAALVGTGVVAGAGGLGVAPVRAADLKEGANPDQDSSEVRWAVLADLSRCSGCRACSIACKTENDVRLGVFRQGVKHYEAGEFPDTQRHFLPWMCNQCKNPSCLKRCPVDLTKGLLEFPNGDQVEYTGRATYQRPDGLVLIDQEACVGCGRCVEDCPYGVRYLDPAKPAGGDPAQYGLDIENPRAADKCTLCVHRLENGVVPACMNTCPAKTYTIGNINDPNSEISQRLAAAGDDVTALWESVGTEPMVFYIGLEEKAFTDGDDPKEEAGLQLITPGV
jgi:tetrathionate reductase subunit B